MYCFDDGTHGRLTNIELLLADNHNNGPTALANADYFIQEQVDLVPAARMQGQIDGLRESLAIPDEHILHLNSKNTYEESHKVINAILPTITSAQHIVIPGINDEVTMGALAVFADVGTSERVIAIGQGADQTARQELQQSGSRMIGSVTLFPEHYGELIT